MQNKGSRFEPVLSISDHAHSLVFNKHFLGMNYITPFSSSQHQIPVNVLVKICVSVLQFSQRDRQKGR